MFPARHSRHVSGHHIYIYIPLNPVPVERLSYLASPDVNCHQYHFRLKNVVVSIKGIYHRIDGRAAFRNSNKHQHFQLYQYHLSICFATPQQTVISSKG
eukprot:scaffold421724_cov28-Prasinocladus_malaysianus.AAC.2